MWTRQSAPSATPQDSSSAAARITRSTWKASPPVVSRTPAGHARNGADLDSLVAYIRTLHTAGFAAWLSPTGW